MYSILCNRCAKYIENLQATSDDHPVYCAECTELVTLRDQQFKTIAPVVSELNKNAIIVWRFQEAPEQYQAMSNNGGDEDWIALVPPMTYEPYWLHQLDTCNDPQVYSIAEGYRIFIGSHS